MFKNSSGWCFPSFPKWTKSHKESVPHFLFFSRSPHTPFIHPTSYFMRGSIPGGYYLRRRFNLFYLPEENIWNILKFLWSARISWTTSDVSPTPIMTKCQLLKEISELFLPKNDYERNKFKYPNSSLPTIGTDQLLLTFFIENLMRVDTLN